MNSAKQSIDGTTTFWVLTTKGKLQCYVHRAEGVSDALRQGRLLTLHREKRARRDKFDLSEAVHKPELSANPPLVGPKKNDKPVKPLHEFEITLEPDTCTDEKYTEFFTTIRIVLICTDIRYSSNISSRSTKILHQDGKTPISSASFVLDSRVDFSKLRARRANLGRTTSVTGLTESSWL